MAQPNHVQLHGSALCAGSSRCCPRVLPRMNPIVTRVADQIIVVTVEKPAKQPVDLAAWHWARCFERNTCLADAAEEQRPIKVTRESLYGSAQVGFNESNGDAIVAHANEPLLSGAL